MAQKGYRNDSSSVEGTWGGNQMGYRPRLDSRVGGGKNKESSFRRGGGKKIRGIEPEKCKHGAGGRFYFFVKPVGGVAGGECDHWGKTNCQKRNGPKRKKNEGKC